MDGNNIEYPFLFPLSPFLGQIILEMFSVGHQRNWTISLLDIAVHGHLVLDKKCWAFHRGHFW